MHPNKVRLNRFYMGVEKYSILINFDHCYHIVFVTAGFVDCMRVQSKKNGLNLYTDFDPFQYMNSGLYGDFGPYPGFGP